MGYLLFFVVFAYVNVMDELKQVISLNKSFLSALSLPQDVVSGDTILTWIGKQRLKIENYRSILLYTDGNIRIQAKKYKVHVSGKRLCIRYYDKDEMEICGMIESVKLE